MSDPSRRRTTLGLQPSAALPLLWVALADRGWNDARLIRELESDSGNVARLLYGDRKATRQQATKLFAMLGIPLESWDQPCPVKRRKHSRTSMQKAA